MMTSILAAYVSPRKLSSMALYSTVPGKPRESHTRSVWIVQIQPTTDTPLRNRESHTRKCVDCSDPTYNRYPSPKPRIPHTAVCGLFRSSLQGQHSPRSRESHTRKCVGCSDPAYNRHLSDTENPTHGSVWIVQIQPTTDTLSDTEN